MTQQDQIRALWAEGHSAGVIAKQLGITRSAVASFVFRAKLPARPTRKRKQKPTTVVRVADPLVREFFDLTNGTESVAALAKRVGVDPWMFHHWARGQSPRLPNFVAALNAIGYRLAIVKDGEG